MHRPRFACRVWVQIGKVSIWTNHYKAWKETQIFQYQPKIYRLSACLYVSLIFSKMKALIFPPRVLWGFGTDCLYTVSTILTQRIGIKWLVPEPAKMNNSTLIYLLGYVLPHSRQWLQLLVTWLIVSSVWNLTIEVTVLLEHISLIYP